MTALSALWDAFDTADLTAADRTGHSAVNVAATGLELDLVKGHAEASRADLANPAAIVKVNIAEADIIGLTFNGAATLLGRIALHLLHFAAGLTPLVQAVAIAAIAAIIVTIEATVRCTDRKAAMAVADRDRRAGALTFAMAFISQSGGGKEQWRR